MKSLSVSSFARDEADVLARAAATTASDPQQLFTDFQWYLYQGRDTVFFAVALRSTLTRSGLEKLVSDMAALAPQLTHGFVGAIPGEPFSRRMLEAIISIREVDGFLGYPDQWLGKSQDIFERRDLPLFRVEAVVRRRGPDERGRASMLLFRASHALLEGSDSALLMRSQSASHGIMSDKTRKVGTLERIGSAMLGWSLAGALLAAAYLLPHRDPAWGFKTLAVERQRLRRLATRIGISQRALYFALVTAALNGDGGMGRRFINANYTILAERRNNADDDFFRVRSLGARFRVEPDFVSFARGVDAHTRHIERHDTRDFQIALNASFMPLRWLHRITGGRMPGARFWQSDVPGKHIVLTVTPPHRTFGAFTSDMIEPIYCGAWHYAANICTFCPGREYVTFNFSLDASLIPKVDRIMTLLEEVEAMDIASTSALAP